MNTTLPRLHSLHPLHLAGLGALSLMLCSCGGEKTPDKQATARGEILPGSASDAMLPFDTVRSQPPIAVSTTASGEPVAQTSGDAASEGAGSADAAATSAPAPTASAAPAE